MFRALSAVLLLASLVFAASPQAKPPRAKSAPAKLTPGKWRGSPILDRVIQQEIQENHIPGAVLIVGHKGKILHRKAYGSRALVPKPEAMTIDTIFDLASLTKVIATTSSVMLLFEEGKIRLNDHVTEYLPGFEGGSSPITVRELMTHFSGLRPDLDLKLAGADRPWSGYDTGIRLALAEKPTVPPGSRFIYSDINFILLGEIVHRVSGKTLDQFARQRVFQPLRMTNTMFNPPARLRRRIAPTERVEEGILRGVVHDPTSRAMGGVAGHAGLFSTADDLARFASMLLGHGRLGNVRIFSPLTVEKMSSPQTPPNQPIERGLGWDLESPLASNRGELLPVGSFGHTGFTGTSLWIDPVTETYIIVLTSRLHPTLRPAPVSLRARIATAVAANLTDVPPDLVEKAGLRLTGYNEAMYGARRVVYRNGQVRTGLDVLARDHFRILGGKRFGLITNHTGIDRQRRRNIDLMAEAGVKPAVIFSPEHGLSGNFDQPDVPDTVDEKTGLHIFSLHQHGQYRPTAEMLRGLDALVFDIQDVGARFYTYMTTMGYCMEEAARHHITFYLLDRPNPINGIAVEGPILDPTHLSFIGYLPLPVRHGMTPGELARLFNGEKKLGADLRVIKMEGWQRGDWFDETGLPWVDPSPNIRNLYEATVYPGVAMLEGLRNYSVGRGTDTPFEVVGADWVDGVALADYLNGRGIPGVRFYPVERMPASSRLAHHKIDGAQILITERDQVDATETGLEIAAALIKLFPGRLDLHQTIGLIGSEAAMRALTAGDDPRTIRENWRDAVEQFRQIREKCLLY